MYFLNAIFFIILLPKFETCGKQQCICFPSSAITTHSGYSYHFHYCYRELEALLDKHSGPKVAEQLSVYKSNLRKKEIQIKSLAAEFNMLKTKMDEQAQYQVERIAQEDQQELKHYQKQ